MLTLRTIFAYFNEFTTDTHARILASSNYSAVSRKFRYSVSNPITARYDDDVYFGFCQIVQISRTYLNSILKNLVLTIFEVG